jgi:hypothetical protein
MVSSEYLTFILAYFSIPKESVPAANMEALITRLQKLGELCRTLLQSVDFIRVFKFGQNSNTGDFGPILQ